MKKIGFIVVIVLGILLAILGFTDKEKESASIGIIGGADGPTAILVAGNPRDALVFGIVLVGVVLIVSGVVIYLKKKKQ